MSLFVNNYIINCLPNYIFNALTYGKFNNKFTYLYVGIHPNVLLKVLSFFFLHHNFQNKLFSDIVAADFPDKNYRFHLVYNILSISYHQRIFLHAWVHELGNITSITSFFPAANWYEREAWDLLGIHFSNNADLRRILTDYGFQGHPLRKDFPLSGFIELFYNSKVDSIIYREINLVQEFRNFDSTTSWNYLS
jgi:NADH dehydrogenase (ubiquinone) Fe-S protein 3